MVKSQISIEIEDFAIHYLSKNNFIYRFIVLSPSILEILLKIVTGPILL